MFIFSVCSRLFCMTAIAICNEVHRNTTKIRGEIRHSIQKKMEKSECNARMPFTLYAPQILWSNKFDFNSIWLFSVHGTTHSNTRCRSIFFSIEIARDFVYWLLISTLSQCHFRKASNVALYIEGEWGNMCLVMMRLNRLLILSIIHWTANFFMLNRKKKKNWCHFNEWW